MKIEDYREGMAVRVRGQQRGFAVELEKCGEDTWVVHVAFPGKETNWRVPIAEVEPR